LARLVEFHQRIDVNRLSSFAEVGDVDWLAEKLSPDMAVQVAFDADSYPSALVWEVDRRLRAAVESDLKPVSLIAREDCWFI
jgi:hypothetical protein